MIGGLIKSNRVAALAGAGFIASALAVSPAQAADLGGDCCADLEERVATLEATTARKGNRKVSLTISGWVNTGILIWDDGHDSDAYVVSDNGATLGSRFTFAGNAKINSKWSAGYNITIEAQQDDPFIGGVLNPGGAANGVGVNQNSDDNVNFGILYSYMWIKNEELGTLSIGKQSQATDNVSIVDLSGTLFNTNNVLFRGNFFDVRTNAGGFSGVPWAAAVGCAGIGTDCHGEPLNVVRYDTPTISGFTLSASWGEDDFWDVALRYAGEFGEFKVAAAIGYSEWDGGDNHLDLSGAQETELLEVGGSIMHTPTGIFVAATYSTYEANTGAVVNADSDAWYVKAGIKQKWNSLGATAIYGEYANYANGENAIDPLDLSDVDRYGIGLHQWIDAASMQVYANWTHLELNVDGGGPLDGSELDTFTVGGVIFF